MSAVAGTIRDTRSQVDRICSAHQLPSRARQLLAFLLDQTRGQYQVEVEFRSLLHLAFHAGFDSERTCMRARDCLAAKGLINRRANSPLILIVVPSLSVVDAGPQSVFEFEDQIPELSSSEAAPIHVGIQMPADGTRHTALETAEFQQHAAEKFPLFSASPETGLEAELDRLLSAKRAEAAVETGMRFPKRSIRSYSSLKPISNVPSYPKERNVEIDLGEGNVAKGQPHGRSPPSRAGPEPKGLPTSSKADQIERIADLVRIKLRDPTHQVRASYGWVPYAVGYLVASGKLSEADACDVINRGKASRLGRPGRVLSGAIRNWGKLGIWPRKTTLAKALGKVGIEFRREWWEK